LIILGKQNPHVYSLGPDIQPVGSRILNFGHPGRSSKLISKQTRTIHSIDYKGVYMISDLQRQRKVLNVS